MDRVAVAEPSSSPGYRPRIGTGFDAAMQCAAGIDRLGGVGHRVFVAEDIVALVHPVRRQADNQRFAMATITQLVAVDLDRFQVGPSPHQPLPRCRMRQGGTTGLRSVRGMRGCRRRTGLLAAQIMVAQFRLQCWCSDVGIGRAVIEPATAGDTTPSLRLLSY